MRINQKSNIKNQGNITGATCLNPTRSIRSHLLFPSFCILHYILMFAFCILNFLGCSRSSKASGPKRIISLVPSITEIIYALGKDSLLVGNTIYCDYPERAKEVYKVGDFSNPSLEKIIKRKPSLVFVTVPEQKNIVEQLKKYKIPVFTTKPQSVDSLFQEITEIGKLLDAKDQAVALVSTLKSKLTEIANKNPNIVDSPRVYVEIAGTPIMTVGCLSYVNDLIRYAGAKNIYSDINREYIVTNSEELVQRNPDIIILLHPQASKSEVKKRLGWSQITAVKRNQIYDDLNPDYFFRPGPRFVYAVEDLANIVHSVWTKKR